MISSTVTSPTSDLGQKRASTSTGESNAVIRTLQIGKSWFPEQAGSGLDRYFYALSRHLPAVNVDVQGLVAGAASLRENPRGISSFAAADDSLPYRLWSVRQAAQRVLSGSPVDLVAAHFALYTAPVIDLLGNTPLVVHFHGPWAQESDVEGDGTIRAWVKSQVERAVYRNGTRFIVLSDAFRDILHTTYDVPVHRIDVIPGGVDLDRFDRSCSQTEARRHLGWPTDGPIVLAVRRLAKRMGLDTLIDAFATVHRRVPDARLYLAGHGPMADALRARARDAGLSDVVRFLGFVPDDKLPYVYAASTLSVVPTRTLEGFGLITVESLASGTPVLVTPVGGLPNVVRDLSPALVFPDASSAAISERLIEVLTDDGVLPSAANCRAYARARHDWHTIARQIRTSYERAIHE